MSYATFDDLRLGLQDFFATKTDAAGQTLAFQIYGPPLRANLTTLENLKRSLDALPLADDLAEVDDEHDAFGRAIYYVGKAVASLKTIDSDTRKTFGEINRQVVPSLGTLMASYEDEAAMADEKQKILAKYDAFLEAFRFGESLTLKDLLTGHVRAAERIKDLLSARAEEVAEDKVSRNRQIMALRGATLGLLSRFRQALIDEVKTNPDLPDDLDTKVFAFFDQLEANRAARADKGETAEPPETAPSESDG